jgi:uncharacterized protein YacL (UPF0231 family)
MVANLPKLAPIG